MKKLLLIAALVPVIGLTGCTVIRELPQEENPVADAQDPQYELSRQLLEAFIKDDAKKFVSLLPSETRKIFTEKEFANTRKSVVDSVGQPISFQYVTKLELDALTPHIWKVRFERKGIRKPDEIFHSELLFRVITGDTGKGAVITAFQFL